MNVALNRSALEALTPGAQELYRQAFDHFSELGAFGVLDSKLRADHFLAQVLHESAGLTALIENLNYSAKRMTQVWPKRFPTLASAQPLAHNPRALANFTYGGRMGNVQPNDGWLFIGRGPLMLTGRSAYRKIGEQLGLDLQRVPTLVLEPEHCLRIAGAIWQRARCNEAADRDSLVDVTERINGGHTGLEDRRSWLLRVRAHNLTAEESHVSQ